MKIMLIDDEEAILRVLELIFRYERYEVVSARNGVEALELLKGDALPDVILVDLMMPVMDGWEFLRRVHADSRLREIPTVVLSASADKRQTIEPRAFIPKPIEMAELLRVLKEVVPA